MKKQVNEFHGSDIEAVSTYFHVPKEDMISFAANVNPLGISPLLKSTLAKQLDVITHYPERDYESLRKAIAEYASTNYQNILVGNGTTELISNVIQTKKPSKAVIIGPSYSEYQREINILGGKTLYYALKEENDFKLPIDDFIAFLNESIDLIVLCNPNNPTGTSVTQKDIRKILDVCKQYDITLMIDETYIEFSDEMEQYEAIPLINIYDNLIILRGISKFFAAPGLRLGYAICGNADLRNEMTKNKNPWTINSLAELAGEIMFTDSDYIAKTKQFISEQKKMCINELSTLPQFKVYPSQANFILIRILDERLTSNELFEICAKQGMMIRDCQSFPFLDNHYFRFCMMEEQDNRKLIDLLKNLV